MKNKKKVLVILTLTLTLTLTTLTGCSPRKNEVSNAISSFASDIEDSFQSGLSELEDNFGEDVEGLKEFAQNLPEHFSMDNFYTFDTPENLRKNLPDLLEQNSKLTQVGNLEISVDSCYVLITSTDKDYIHATLEDNSTFKRKLTFAITDRSDTVMVSVLSKNHPETYRSGNEEIRLLTIYIPKTMTSFNNIDIESNVSYLDHSGFSANVIEIDANVSTLSLENTTARHIDIDANVSQVSTAFVKLNSFELEGNVSSLALMSPTPTADSELSTNLCESKLFFLDTPTNLNVQGDSVLKDVTIPDDWDTTLDGFSKRYGNGSVDLDIDLALSSLEIRVGVNE